MTQIIPLRRPIRFRVVTPTHTALYTMPWSDAPVAALGGLPADMLQRAVLYLDGATGLPPEAVEVPATLPPAPAGNNNRKRKRA